MKTKIFLAILSLAFYITDIIITLTHQTTSYWNGKYAEANEAHFIGKFFLEQNPGFFISIAVVWSIIFTLTILIVPIRMATILSALLILGHTLGVASWIIAH